MKLNPKAIPKKDFEKDTKSCSCLFSFFRKEKPRNLKEVLKSKENYETFIKDIFL